MGIKKGSKVVIVRVLEDIYEELKVYVDKEGKSISEVAREAINELLKGPSSVLPEPDHQSGVEELEGRFVKVETNYREF